MYFSFAGVKFLDFALLGVQLGAALEIFNAIIY